MPQTAAIAATLARARGRVTMISSAVSSFINARGAPPPRALARGRRSRGAALRPLARAAGAFPLPALGGLQHRIGDVIGGEAIAERRGNTLALDRRARKI